MTIPLFLDGVEHAAQVFVAAMGVSGRVYAEATLSQKIDDWCSSHVRCFEDMGWAPQVAVPDNVKAAVKNPSRYEPVLNETYADLLEHYDIQGLPARVKKPRDNALVKPGDSPRDRRQGLSPVPPTPGPPFCHADPPACGRHPGTNLVQPCNQVKMAVGLRRETDALLPIAAEAIFEPRERHFVPDELDARPLVPGEHVFPEMAFCLKPRQALNAVPLQPPPERSAILRSAHGWTSYCSSAALRPVTVGIFRHAFGANRARSCQTTGETGGDNRRVRC